MSSSSSHQHGPEPEFDASEFPRAPFSRRPKPPASPHSAEHEHPENDLLDDPDYSNVVPPTPRNADELATQDDPLTRAARNRASAKQARWYVIVALATSFIFPLILAVVMRFIAGAETCEAAGARLLCRQDLWRTWAVLSSLPPVAFLIGSMVIMVRKLNAYLRWRPWMGVFWVMVPLTMWTLTITMQVWLAQSAPV